MKLTRSQIRSIKKAAKDAELLEEVENEEPKLTIADAKRAAKAHNDQEGHDTSEAARIKSSMKRQARRDKNVKIQWNFEVGDTVEYKDRSGKIQIGLVAKMGSPDRSFESMRHAKTGHQVLIVSAAGNNWVYASKVTKL